VFGQASTYRGKVAWPHCAAPMDERCGAAPASSPLWAVRPAGRTEPPSMPPEPLGTRRGRGTGNYLLGHLLVGWRRPVKFRLGQVRVSSCCRVSLVPPSWRHPEGRGLPGWTLRYPVTGTTSALRGAMAPCVSAQVAGFVARTNRSECLRHYSTAICGGASRRHEQVR